MSPINILVIKLLTFTILTVVNGEVIIVGHTSQISPQNQHKFECSQRLLKIILKKTCK